MPEKRQHLRKRIDSAMRVIDINSNQAIGSMVDLSESGFMMLSNQAITAGTVLQLRIELPRQINGQMSVNVGAESLWCGAANVPEHFLAGFHIIDIDESATATLESLMN